MVWSRFNRINKRDLKRHPCKMHTRKERKNYDEVDLLKENQDLLKTVMSGMRKRKNSRVH